ncbi:MAG: type II toxin-antitoxin system RelE/ParE family toxin [Bacteroidetes bacterium]|nr:type II toxin-antitoxin system RelE/ParE family toxin [Bacteroidota bacterium]
MELHFTKTFLKDLAKVQPVKRRKQIEEFVFEIMPLSLSLESLGLAEKMTGYENFYKIRFGDYRIGLNKTSTHIELIRVLHRKEIYKVFP